MPRVQSRVPRSDSASTSRAAAYGARGAFPLPPPPDCRKVRRGAAGRPPPPSLAAPAYVASESPPALTRDPPQEDAPACARSTMGGRASASSAAVAP
jgi:hypothetical protein